MTCQVLEYQRAAKIPTGGRQWSKSHLRADNQKVHLQDGNNLLVENFLVHLFQSLGNSGTTADLVVQQGQPGRQSGGLKTFKRNHSLGFTAAISLNRFHQFANDSSCLASIASVKFPTKVFPSQDWVILPKNFRSSKCFGFRVF
jgi:hypothetical protein